MPRFRNIILFSVANLSFFFQLNWKCVFLFKQILKMNFTDIITLSHLIKEKQLTEWKSHKKMAPTMRLHFTDEMIDNKNPRDAAVLVLLYPNANNKIQILLTKRASYNGAHSGQISFPGGKKDTSDLNLKQTALRETKEETGIILQPENILKKLSKTYIPPSNFWVYPFLAIQHKTPHFKPNYEVEKILEIPLKELLDDRNLICKNITTSYMKNAKVPCFKINNEIIWGATAMILSEVKDLIKPIL
ncbi:MAG TPA: CoA pyrophosphatase [Flavobacteriia bacterium]|nr:CoA pyrophosphatase [Flavobacteriia bacterium]